MTYDRIKSSERNKVIEDFRNGKPDPNYEVFPSKKEKGKYTVRRKQPPSTNPDVALCITNPELEMPEETPKEEPLQEETQEYNPFNDEELYYPQKKLTKQQIFTQMQLMMNEMFIENFKAMRKEQKRSEKKRKQVGDKAKKIHDILINVASQEEEIPKTTIQEPKKEELTITNNKEQPYEEELNNLARPEQQSRRDRLKTFI